MKSKGNGKVKHVPVLLKEVIELLDIDPDGNYIDCTLGDGGYSVEILNRLEKGTLISLDWDKASIEFVNDKYSELLSQKNWKIVRDNFANLEEVVESVGVGDIQGIVFDLGLSSRQLDSQERGFSFRFSSDLDMRMSEELKIKAEDLLKVLKRGELQKLFSKYGEERYSARIASAIKDWIDENPKKDISTDTLVSIVGRVVPASYRKGSKHPSTRVFQALRIAVNDELNNLKKGLNSALSVVASDGKIVVVSYHSLEDRIVKNNFSEAVSSGMFTDLTDGIVTPSQDEIQKNPRSSSAKLRVVKKI